MLCSNHNQNVSFVFNFIDFGACRKKFEWKKIYCKQLMLILSIFKSLFWKFSTHFVWIFDGGTNLAVLWLLPYFHVHCNIIFWWNFSNSLKFSPFIKRGKNCSEKIRSPHLWISVLFFSFYRRVHPSTM